MFLCCIRSTAEFVPSVLSTRNSLVVHGSDGESGVVFDLKALEFDIPRGSDSRRYFALVSRVAWSSRG